METIAIAPTPQAPQATQAQSSNASSEAGNQDFNKTLANSIDKQNNQTESSKSDQNSESAPTNSTDSTDTANTELKEPPKHPDTQTGDDQPAGLPHSDNSVQTIISNESVATTAPQQQVLAALQQQLQNGESQQQGLTKQSLQDNQTPVQQTPVQQTESANKVLAQPQETKPSSILAQKIEEIISNSNEKGTVTIREQAVPANGTPAKAPMMPIQEPAVNQASVAATLDPKLQAELAPAKGFSKVAQMRMEAQQSVAQNVQVETVQNNGQQAQQSFADSSTGGNQANLATSTVNTVVTTETTTTSFAQVAATQSTNSQTLVQTAPSTPAAPQIPFHEGEVMNQIIQRFNVNPRLQTSKLSLQLNPAELGELKIDILVKGDTIKANIVAQSQQVQELIEKNMIRLRSVLEEQGFSIEDLIVSFSSENGDGSNFFQENYAQQDQFFDTKNNNSNTTNFELPLEELISQESVEEQVGVNVKV